MWIYMTIIFISAASASAFDELDKMDTLSFLSFCYSVIWIKK